MQQASVSNSIFQNIFRAKDGVLTELAQFMFSNQFAMARSTAGTQLPPIYVYAVETAIQMTLTELNENLREIYIEAYTQKEASDYIFRETAKELYQIFSPYQPELTEQDFYFMEIGSAGIMRGFMAHPCDEALTLEKKLRTFLTMSLRSYHVPEDEIKKAVDFIGGMDIRAVSERVITDSYSTKTELPDDPCVVSLYGSFAECWLLSGGKLAGITEDAVDEHGIEIDDDTALVGTVTEPNLESVAALSPDYVILSADLPAHAELDSALTDMQIPHGYFRMDNVMDYAKIMLNFCAVNDPDGEKYDENVTRVLKRIESIKQETAEKLSGQKAPTVLLLRAYSTGVKAKGEDTVAGAILKELGAHNIADDNESLLEDLSLESVIEADPDYILVMTMGSEENAKTYMAENIENNPAWSELSAVKNGRYIYLPKDLFHYKPLNRWDESYAYIAKLLLNEDA